MTERRYAHHLGVPLLGYTVLGCNLRGLISGGGYLRGRNSSGRSGWRPQSYWVYTRKVKAAICWIHTRTRSVECSLRAVKRDWIATDWTAELTEERRSVLLGDNTPPQAASTAPCTLTWSLQQTHRCTATVECRIWRRRQLPTAATTCVTSARPPTSPDTVTRTGAMFTYCVTVFLTQVGLFYRGFLELQSEYAACSRKNCNATAIYILFTVSVVC